MESKILLFAVTRTELRKKTGRKNSYSFGITIIDREKKNLFLAVTRTALSAKIKRKKILLFVVIRTALY